VWTFHWGTELDAESSVTGVPIARSIPLTGAARLLAEHMMRCHAAVPAVTIFEEWCVDRLVQFRSGFNDKARAEGRTLVSYTHLLIGAVALALREHPLLNAVLADGIIQLLGEINIGIATSLSDGGLVVPVLRNADKVGLEGIAAGVRELVERASRGALRTSDVRGGTFTLTNIGGTSDARWQTPLVNMPQSAILAVGAIRQAPIVRDGVLEVGYLMCASLTFDHRIVNGKPAADFLKAVADRCRNPECLTTAAPRASDDFPRSL